MHDGAVHGAGEKDVGGVSGGTGDLETTVITRDWLSDGGHARAPAVCSARRATRCASSILKALWVSGTGVGKGRGDGSSQFIGFIQRNPAQCFFRCREPPRPVSNATHRQPGRANAFLVYGDRSRSRYERELIGLTVAKFQVVRSSALGSPWHLDRNNQIAALEHVVSLGRAARQAVEVRKRDRSLPRAPRIRTIASMAANATATSEGWVATQASDHPKIA